MRSNPTVHRGFQSSLVGKRLDVPAYVDKIYLMIKLHRLNKKEFVLNADLIRYLESTPDTLITLQGGEDKIMVLESVDEVLRLVKVFRHECYQGPLVAGKE